MAFRNKSVFLAPYKIPLAKSPVPQQQGEPIIGFTPKNRLTISQIGSREPLYFKVKEELNFSSERISFLLEKGIMIK